MRRAWVRSLVAGSSVMFLVVPGLESGPASGQTPAAPAQVLTGPGIQRGELHLPPLLYGRTYATTLVIQNSYPTPEAVTIRPIAVAGGPLPYFTMPTALTLQPFERREIPIVITTPPLLLAPPDGAVIDGVIGVEYLGRREPDQPQQIFLVSVSGHIYRQPSDQGRAIDRHVASLLVGELGELIPTIDKSAFAYDLLYKRDWPTVIGTLATTEFLDPNNRPASPTTMVALLAVAKASAANADGFVARLNTLLAKDEAGQRRVAGYLRDRAVQIADTHRQLTDVTSREEYLARRIAENPEYAPAQWTFDMLEARDQRQVLAQQYYQQLTAEPMLGLRRGDTLLWQALAATPGMPVSAAAEVTTSYFTAGVDHFTQKANEFRNLRDVQGLWQFRDAAYAPVRQQIVRYGQQAGSEVLPYLMAELEGVNAGVVAIDRADDMDLATTTAIVAAAGSVVVGPVASVGGAAIDTGVSLFNLSEASAQLENAQDLGPVLGYDSILGLEKRRNDAKNEVFVSVIFGMADATELGFRIVKGGSLLDLGRGATELPSVKGVGVVVADGTSIVNRLDASYVATGQMKVTAAEFGQFIHNTGLGPVVTVRSGPTVLHLSEPFQGPGGRRFVYAFEELENGNVAVNVVYRSNEHSVVRLMPSGGMGEVDKGPKLKPVVSDEPFDGTRSIRFKVPNANEASVDVIDDLQLPIAQWMSGREARALSYDLEQQAFFGAVPLDPKHSRLAPVLTVDNVLRPPPPGFMDFRSPPTLINRWWDNSPLYGPVEKFHYRSADGTVDYHVVRDRHGDVFVPHAQAAGVGAAGPIKASSFDTGGQTSTKFVHEGQGRRGPNGRLEQSSDQIPVEFREEYTFDANFETDLSRTFAGILPPPGSYDPTSLRIDLPSSTPTPGPPGPPILGPSPTRATLWTVRGTAGATGPDDEASASGATAAGTPFTPATPVVPTINWITDRSPLPSLEVRLGSPERLQPPPAGRGPAPTTNPAGIGTSGSGTPRTGNDAPLKPPAGAGATGAGGTSSGGAGTPNAPSSTNRDPATTLSEHRGVLEKLNRDAQQLQADIVQLRQDVQEADGSARQALQEKLNGAQQSLRSVNNFRAIMRWEVERLERPTAPPPAAPPPPAPDRSLTPDGTSTRNMSVEFSNGIPPGPSVSLRSEATPEPGADTTETRPSGPETNRATATEPVLEIAPASPTGTPNSATTIPSPATPPSSAPPGPIPTPVTPGSSKNDPKLKYDSPTNAGYGYGWRKSDDRMWDLTLGYRLEAGYAPGAPPLEGVVADVNRQNPGPKTMVDGFATAVVQAAKPDDLPQDQATLAWIDNRPVLASNDSPPSSPWATGGLLAALRGTLHRLRVPWPYASRASAVPEMWMAPSYESLQSSRSQLGDERPSVKLFFTSLGRSSGESVRMTVVNDGNVPVRIALGAVALEPLEKLTERDVERELKKLAGRNHVTVNVEAYCLNYRKPPPAAGMVMRLAGAQKQAKMAPIARIGEATRRLRERGGLEPDTDDATEYAHDMVQWSIWTHQERFDQRGFTRAFVEHVRKNFVAAGDTWTREIEQAVTALTPQRWTQIQAILREADTLQR